MKISELISLLEKAKEEYGNVEVYSYECGDYIPVETIVPICNNGAEFGIEIY